MLQDLCLISTKIYTKPEFQNEEILESSNSNQLHFYLFEVLRKYINVYLYFRDTARLKYFEPSQV